MVNPDKPCEKCGKTTVYSKVVNGETRQVTWQGWICGHCQHIDKAIGREKDFEDGTENHPRG